MEKNSLGCFGIIIITLLIFFGSALILSPMISKLGYTSVESSYHLMTHALIVSMVVTVLTCTKIIVDKIDLLMDKIDQQNK